MKFTSTKRLMRRVAQLIMAFVIMVSVGNPIPQKKLVFRELAPPGLIGFDSWRVSQAEVLSKLEQKRLDRLVYEAEQERLRLEHEAYIASRSITKTVYLTNYYIGDGSSGSVTASGKNVSQFEVNEIGWYTYKGKVVLAGAMNYCLRRTTGICRRWNVLPLGWVSFDFYDEVTIIYQGKSYRGVFLDLCGAAMYRINGEQYQRIDVFIYKNHFGKVLGQIKYTLDD